LLVFADDWGRHPSSCQHLIRRLLGRYEVFWVNTIGMRRPRFDLATLRRGLEKLGQWAWRRRQSTPLPAGLHVLNPSMWPSFRSRLGRRLNRSLLLRHLTPLLRSLPEPPVAVTTVPIVADLVGTLPVRRWVYYFVDDFGQWPGLDQVPLRRLDEQLIRSADVLIAASETLQENIRHLGRAARVLTHGVDLDFWTGESATQAVAELGGLERPLVVFWGVSDRRMDVAFVKRLAAELSAGTIVLVGPEADPDPALYATPRVVRLPPLAFDQLPSLAREAGVLVMPYADLPVTRAIQPLKLKEYLATGKPVVARTLPATSPWGDCLDLANTAEAFSQAVRHRLARGLPPEQRQARLRLREESWEAKARDFERWALHPGARCSSPEGLVHGAEE
jgi:glycosyltransferase involved in cell wall biosynthesis